MMKSKENLLNQPMHCDEMEGPIKVRYDAKLVKKFVVTSWDMSSVFSVIFRSCSCAYLG